VREPYVERRSKESSRKHHRIVTAPAQNCVSRRSRDRGAIDVDATRHHWTFGPDGRVVALRHFLDTAEIIAATRGEDTTTS
jgi:hypothetical protein